MADDTSITTEHVWDRIDNQHVAMLLTYDGNHIEARPMAPTVDRARHRISFITGHPSEKTTEIQENGKVTVLFANPATGLYVTIHGSAVVTKDRKTLEELWGPIAEAYFPEGIEGGKASALVFTPEKAHVWEENNTLKQGWTVLTSLFSSDKTPDMGKSATVRM